MMIPDAVQLSVKKRNLIIHFLKTDGDDDETLCAKEPNGVFAVLFKQFQIPKPVSGLET